MTDNIQEFYATRLQKGLPGQLARPNAPWDQDLQKVNEEMSPGMGCYYSAGDDAFILPVSAATRLLVTHVVSFDPTSNNVANSALTANNNSEVVFAADSVAPLASFGSFFVMAGDTLENEDAVIYNETTEKWVKYEPASPTANDLRKVPFVAYLDPGKTVADGEIVEIKIPSRNYSVPSLSDLDSNTVEVAIAATDIKALRATPYELVAAQGANQLIRLESITLKLTAGSEVLTESADNLVVEYDDGSAAACSQVIECTGFIDQAADTITTGEPAINTIDAVADVANTNIALFNNGDGEFAGNASDDAVLTAYVTYRVIDLS